MNGLNAESFFKAFPTMAHKRTRFPFSKEINFNMKVGEITPIAAIRVVPGQTYNLDMSTVLKVAPLQVPPQDNMVFKACAFYQADRNNWVNYKYWFGEKQKPENPEEEPTYVVPKVTLPKGGFAYNSFYDNIGCPPEKGGYKIDAYLPRMDREVYNTYFRNQSLENPLEINKGDEDDDPMQNMELRKVCKPRDFFTQCLPNQSGGTPVEIPLGTEAPVIGNKTAITLNDGVQEGNMYSDTTNPYRMGVVNGSAATGTPSSGRTVIAQGGSYGLTEDPTKSGMIALLSQAVGAPLEGLYQAVAYNTMQYITSRGGNRYFEQLENIYGCANPEGVLQLPEFLGSVSQMIDFDTITQTSDSTDQNTGLAHRAANGYLEDYGSIINKSFGEFGWIIIYGFVTMYPKYQQGVSKLMQTSDPLELFNPIFNLIGDEPVFRSEIYVQDDDVVNENGTPINDEVFGYGKRNSRILYPINEIHGEQRSSYSQSLDANHFAQYFNEMPTLNKEFDKVTDESFKRALQITDETQFIGNVLITGTNDVEIPRDAIPMIVPSIALPN